MWPRRVSRWDLSLEAFLWSALLCQICSMPVHPGAVGGELRAAAAVPRDTWCHCILQHGCTGLGSNKQYHGARVAAWLRHQEETGGGGPTPPHSLRDVAAEPIEMRSLGLSPKRAWVHAKGNDNVHIARSAFHLALLGQFSRAAWSGNDDRLCLFSSHMTHSFLFRHAQRQREKANLLLFQAEMGASSEG